MPVEMWDLLELEFQAGVSLWPRELGSKLWLQTTEPSLHPLLLQGQCGPEMSPSLLHLPSLVGLSPRPLQAPGGSNQMNPSPRHHENPQEASGQRLSLLLKIRRQELEVA